MKFGRNDHHPDGCFCRPCILGRESENPVSDATLDAHLEDLEVKLRDLAKQIMGRRAGRGPLDDHAWRLVSHFLTLVMDLEQVRISRSGSWHAMSGQYGSTSTCLFLADWCRRIRSIVLEPAFRKQ